MATKQLLSSYIPVARGAQYFLEKTSGRVKDCFLDVFVCPCDRVIDRFDLYISRALTGTSTNQMIPAHISCAHFCACVRLITAKVHPVTACVLSLQRCTLRASYHCKDAPLRLPPRLECPPYSTPAFLNAEVAPLRFSTLKLPPAFLNAKV